MPGLLVFVGASPIDRVWERNVWLTFTGFVNTAKCRHVPLTRTFAIWVSVECRSVR